MYNRLLMGTIALVIFALVYLVIILGEHSPRHLDRPAAALIGAVLMVVCGVLTRSQALQSVDFPTLALLFGMMMIVHYATVSGLLAEMATRFMAFGNSPSKLFWVICFSAGILSALFVNDTICLLMTPLVLTMTKRANLPAAPYLICLATSSNVGSATTITGNPQNMLIGQSSAWTWPKFALLMIPIGIVCLLINGLIVKWVYRRQLPVDQHPIPKAPAELPLNRKLAVKTAIVAVCLLVGFLIGAPMDMMALSAGVALLVWANRPPEETFAAIDWSLLLFFAGLFVVVRGITDTHLADMNRLIPLFTGHATTLRGVSLFSGATVIASNIFGNVPFVMLIRGWIAANHNAQLLWLLLAMASTFAGNLTLLGSVANLIVASAAKNDCKLGFVEFLKAGVPSTIVTVAAGTAVIYGYHVLGWT
jgi:Na+/H+ antiporter NhaD/arsenite permease-like protein